MRFFLNKFDTSPELNSTSAFKRKPMGKILFYGLILIAFSTLLILNYDPGNPNAEKDLTALHERYTKGEKLDKKEFAPYCLLLEKVWKRHLLSCYCPDGVINPTNGIDWTNPPNSPEKLGNEWMEVTNEKVRSKSKRRDFIHKLTDEKIVFEFGMTFKDGNKQEDHWHRYNPLSKNDKDLYLDKCGKPVGKSDKDSHIWIKNLQPWTP
jgi:hypothetical protein